MGKIFLRLITLCCLYCATNLLQLLFIYAIYFLFSCHDFLFRKISPEAKMIFPNTVFDLKSFPKFFASFFFEILNRHVLDIPLKIFENIWSSSFCYDFYSGFKFHFLRIKNIQKSREI